MIDKKDFAIIGLVAVLVVGLVAYMSERASADYLLMLEEVNQTAYAQGVQDTVLLINQGIINTLQENGELIVFNPVNDTVIERITLSIKSIEQAVIPV